MGRGLSPAARDPSWLADAAVGQDRRLFFLIYISEYDLGVVSQDVRAAGAVVLPSRWYEPPAGRTPDMTLGSHLEGLLTPSPYEIVVPIRYDHLIDLEAGNLLAASRPSTRLLLLRRRRPLTEAASSFLDDHWNDWRELDEEQRYGRMWNRLYEVGRAMADVQSYVDALDLRMGLVQLNHRRDMFDFYLDRIARLLRVDQSNLNPQWFGVENQDVLDAEDELSEWFAERTRERLLGPRD